MLYEQRKLSPPDVSQPSPQPQLPSMIPTVSLLRSKPPQRQTVQSQPIILQRPTVQPPPLQLLPQSPTIQQPLSRALPERPTVQQPPPSQPSRGNFDLVFF